MPEESMEAQMLTYIRSNDGGVSDATLSAKYPEIRKQLIAAALNTLLQQGLIDVKKVGKTLVYSAVQDKSCSYEALILSLIAQEGSSGLWLKDIKSKTNIPHNLVLKILKALEDARKIKSIKSIKNNRKIYILYDVVPDEDMSGGIWFSNNDVDLMFVNKLMEMICQFARRPEGPFALNRIDSLVRLKTIKDFITASKISEVCISEEDINTLINCLVYDGKLERIEGTDGIVLRVLRDGYIKP